MKINNVDSTSKVLNNVQTFDYNCKDKGVISNGKI
tara:strand:- start:7457 stop:7561 length:105 start_codon:yes stop_codon:yes gene_type:complete